MNRTNNQPPVTSPLSRPCSRLGLLLLSGLLVTCLCLTSGCLTYPFDTASKNAPDASLCGPFPDNYMDLLKAWVPQTRGPQPAHIRVKDGSFKLAFEVKHVVKPLPARDAAGAYAWVVPVFIERRWEFEKREGNTTFRMLNSAADLYELFIRDGQIKNTKRTENLSTRQTERLLSHYGLGRYYGRSGTTERAGTEAWTRARELNQLQQ